jgi:ribosome-associated protein
MEFKSIKIKEDFIRLDSLLKFSGLVYTGGHAKMVIQSGEVKVNGETCLMRGKKIYKNDISVAFNIVFGQLRFFFGGDITNTSIRKIPNDYFQNTVFVKIPHHGSSTSNILIDKYKNINHDLIEASNPIIAVSTIFEDHHTHLPETNVLDSYRTISNGILVTNNTTNKINNLGIWSLKYKLNSQKVSYEPISKGDAYIYK